MKNKGFTLVEILIALAIFAVVAVITSIGLHSVLKTRLHLHAVNSRLREIMLAETIMRRDFMQIANRKIQDIHGEQQPAFLSTSRSALEFTRAGFSSSRSGLQRVAYQWQQDTLYRLSWPVLDRVPQTTPRKKALLTGVKSWELQYVWNHNILQSWSDEQGLKNRIPQAVIVQMTLPKSGTLEWVFLVRGRHVNT